MTHKHCVICRSSGIRVDGVLLVCTSCGHGYRPYVGDTIEYHRSLFRREHVRAEGEVAPDGRIEKSFHVNRRLIVERRIKRTSRFLRGSQTVLDVGGGAGTFAMAVREIVPSVDVIEVAPNLVDECRANGIPCEQTGFLEFDTKGRVWDVVTAWHVLEHIDDASATARKLMESFSSYLIIEIPISRKVPDRFDGHHHYFTHESFQELFKPLVIEAYTSGIQHPALFAVMRKHADYSG